MAAKTVWLIVLGLLVAGAWLPTNYVHRSLFPTEDPKFIRRVFAGHTVGQTFHTKYNIDRIRLLARAARPLMQTLSASVDNQVISIPVALVPEDQWITLALPEALPPREYQLTLSAPDISSQADAILVRFQVDSTNFEPGSMIVDGEESYGDLAFQLVDRIPAWVQIPRYFVAHPNHAAEVFRVATLTLLCSLFFFRFSPSKKTWRFCLIALFAFTLAIRIPTLAQIDGVFGGDALNYLSKAKAWLLGDDPFNAEARKGPFLPFVLMPTLLTKDPLLWSRFLGAISAGLAAAATAYTLKRLRLMPALALLGGLLVAVNRELWWESLNGLANVPYAALITLSTASLAQNAPFAAGLFTSLAALTRYEGILVSAIYLPALWLKNHFNKHILRRSFVPLLLLVIPFVFWPLTGALGIRTASDVLEDTGLYVAWDWHDYATNLNRAKHFLQQLWFFRHDPPLSWFNDALNLTAILGALVLARRRPSVGIPLVLVVVSQIAAVTAILPKTRYYVQIIPLLAIGGIYGLSLLPRRAGIILASLLVASVWMNTRIHLPSVVEAYNYRARADSVLMQASVYLKKIESRPAFATNFFAVETYFPLSQVVMGAPEEMDEQIAWLREKSATHLVETSEHPWFEELLKTHPQNFQYLTSFNASYDPAHATIYRINWD